MPDVTTLHAILDQKTSPGKTKGGVKASEDRAKTHLAKAKQLKAMVEELGPKHNLPPAVILALMARESDFGVSLAKGWGDKGNAFGVLQVDKRTAKPAGQPDPFSKAHVDQALGIWDAQLAAVQKARKDWSEADILAGTICAYNAGAGNVKTAPTNDANWRKMDDNKPNTDYSADVWAMAAFYREAIWGKGKAVSGGSGKPDTSKPDTSKPQATPSPDAPGKTKEDPKIKDQSQWTGADGLKYTLELNHTCEWKKAINWHPKFTGTFGYLMTWDSTGGADLKADLQLVDPTQSDSSATLSCVGVIEQFKFDGAADDPILIIAYVSSDNASTVRGKFLGILPDTSVQVSWNIVTCEGAGEGWYQTAWTEEAVSAQILTDTTEKDTGGHLRVAINPKCDIIDDTEGKSNSVDIRLYRFGFQIVPAPGGSADLQFANGKSLQFTKPWGGDDGDTE